MSYPTGIIPLVSLASLSQPYTLGSNCPGRANSARSPQFRHLRCAASARSESVNDVQIGRLLMITTLRAGAIALALFGLCDGGQAFADPLGTWLTENGRSRIKIENCGGALCGNIVWLKEPNDPETGKPKLDKNNADAAKRSRALIGVQI